MEFFDRESVRDLHRRLQETLDQFAKEMGLKAIVGSSTFTPYNICFKVEMAVVTKQGEALTREAENFFHQASFYGLAPEDLGKTFRYGHCNYKVVGLNARSRTAPILVVDENGKRFKFRADTLKTLLSAQPNSTQQTPVQANLPLEDA
jgi:hypothetical protein